MYETQTLAQSMMNVIIVDDEPLAIRGLDLRLAPHSDIRIIGRYTNGIEAISAITKLKPDVVFLDIEMPNLDGFSVLSDLELSPTPHIIFVTAYDKYAVKAFEAHAFDYILKPIDDERLNLVLSRLREENVRSDQLRRAFELTATFGAIKEQRQISTSQVISETVRLLKAEETRSIFVRDRGRRIKLSIDEIIVVHADRDYVNIVARNNTYLIRSTMKTMERQLESNDFLRIHRSTIVNMKHVAELVRYQGGDYRILLSNGVEKKIGRKYLPQVLSKV